MNAPQLAFQKMMADDIFNAEQPETVVNRTDIRYQSRLEDCAK